VNFEFFETEWKLGTATVVLLCLQLATTNLKSVPGYIENVAHISIN